MIELRNVKKRFGNLCVLDGVNITFDKGLIGIKGVSGEGKSTLLNLISSLDDEYEGDILFDGVNYRSILDKEKFRYDNFGFVFQNPVLFDLLSVFDNVCYDDKCTYINKQKVSNVLASVDLNVNVDESVNHLSGGEKQRLSIARCLFHNARVILCDEPTGALDWQNSKLIMKLLKDISKERLVIVVSHQEDLLYEYADKVYLLKDRNLILDYWSDNDLSIVKGSIKRKNVFNLKVMIRYIVRNLKVKKVRSTISFFSIGLGLFSIGISSLIAFIVSSSIEDSLMGEFEEDKFFIKSKNENVNGFNEKYASSIEDVELIAEDCENVEYVGSFYFSSFEEQMVDKNCFEMSIDNFVTIFSELNIRSINEFQLLDDSQVVFPSYPKKLSDDEIVLSLRKKDIKRICQNLNLIGNDENALSDYLLNNSLSFTYIGKNFSWEYEVEVFFKCSYFVVSDDIGIYHLNSFWNQYIFEEKMQLIASNDLLAYSYLPWTIKKVFYLKVDEFEQINVIKELICDKKWNDYFFDFIDSSNSKLISRNNKKTGRIYVTTQSDVRFNISDVLDKNISFFGNNSTYYIYEKMLLNGFIKPTFLVKNEHKLISLIDEFSFTEDDLMTLNFFDESVCYGSLSSIMEETHLKFKSIEEVNNLIGRKSFSYQEIVISSSVVDVLFKGMSISDVLHQDLYFLTLSDSFNEKEVYHNSFAYVKLKVVGVVNDIENVIYGDSLWTSLFYVDNFSFSLSDNLPVNGIIRESSLSSGEYVIVDPFTDIINDMNDLLYYIKLGLNVFSVMSIICAILMNIVIMYLYIDESRKEIALMIALGIDKKNVIVLFVLFSLIIGLVSFVYAELCLLVSSLLLAYEFGSFNYFSVSLFYEISFVIFIVMFVVSIIIGFISSKNVLDRKILISLKEK